MSCIIGFSFLADNLLNIWTQNWSKHTRKVSHSSHSISAPKKIHTWYFIIVWTQTHCLPLSLFPVHGPKTEQVAFLFTVYIENKELADCEEALCFSKHSALLTLPLIHPHMISSFLSRPKGLDIYVLHSYQQFKCDFFVVPSPELVMAFKIIL